MSYTIIGSGPTGLTLAYILALNNYNVTIIEQDNQLGGSWNSQWIDDMYFSENSPRIYLETKNSKLLFTHLGLKDSDFKNIYGNLFTTNYKFVSFLFKYFNFFDYFLFIYSFIKYRIVTRNITIQEWINEAPLSENAKKAIKIISILICDIPEKTNVNDFFNSITALGIPKQMREPNKWHTLIEEYLTKKSNVKIYKNSKVIKLLKNNNNFSVYVKNDLYNYNFVINSVKVFLCTQSNGIYPILKNSDLDIQNNWMPIEKMKKWSANTFYSGFGFQLHFDRKVMFKDEWCWSCSSDWTVIILPVSNWLKQNSKDKRIKTVWSCCIVDLNTLSKRINKTANQCNLQEVLQECLYQIKQNYNIPDPTRLTYSNGLVKINNKWVSKNTGYTKGTYNDIPLKGAIDNLYALGSFTKSLNDQISTMNASIDSVAEYLNTYERLDINLFNQ